MVRPPVESGVGPETGAVVVYETEDRMVTSTLARARVGAHHVAWSGTILGVGVGAEVEVGVEGVVDDGARVV